MFKSIGSWLASLLKDTIVRTVVASISTIGLTALLCSWWSVIAKALGASATWLLAPVSIDRWILIALIAVAVTTVVALLVFGWLHFRGLTQAKMTDYWQDRFHGLRWQWRIDYANNITNLTPLCDKCYSEVRAEQLYVPPPRVQLICLSCGNRSEVMSGTLQMDVFNAVKVQIRRKLRSGDWVQAIKDMK